MSRTPGSASTVHADFKRLFFRKEGYALAGHRYANIWILVGILFITFMAIGFANGSLSYLQQKMDDPFINWVSVEVPTGVGEEIDKVKTVLNNTENRTEFGYGSVTTNRRYLLRIFSPNDSNNYIARGRTIEPDNPMLAEIINSPNLLSGRGFEAENDIGLLVTQEFLRKLGYAEDVGFITMAYAAYEDEKDALLPLPIAGIVKQLPGKQDFASTPYFYSQRKIGRTSGNPFDPRNTQELLLHIEGDEDQAYELYQQLEILSKEGSFAEKFGEISPYPIRPYPEEASYRGGFLTGFSFQFANPGSRAMAQKQWQMFEALMKESSVRKYDPQRVYRYNFDNQIADNLNADRISIHFNSLDRIRDFRAYLLSEELKRSVRSDDSDLGLDIDLAQIEAKENYNFVSRLTRIISLILIGFSVLSICLFVSHMFQKHLDKVSRNIGTFKAFGMDNQALISIYLRLISVFMVGATLTALILAAIVGSLGGIKVLLMLISDRLEPGETYFELLNPWTGLALVLLLGISLFVLFRTASKILSRTPGDLIYKRI